MCVVVFIALTHPMLNPLWGGILVENSVLVSTLVAYM